MAALASLEEVERIEELLREDVEIGQLFGTNSAFADGTALMARRNAHLQWLRRSPDVVPPTPVQLEEAAADAFQKLAEAVRNDPRRIV